MGSARRRPPGRTRTSAEAPQRGQTPPARAAATEHSGRWCKPIQSDTRCELGRELTLGAEAAAQLRFRQLNEKEAFTLADPSGTYFRAALVELREGSARAQVYEALAASPESPLELTLFCAVLARQRMLTVIQKATELGVARVVPLLTERSVHRDGLEHEKAHAWPAQALRAVRQCRRASVPLVEPALEFQRALAHPAVRAAQRVLCLDDRADAAGLEHAEVPLLRVSCFVGPEGGFTDAERTLLDAVGARSLRLGARVLRAETAVLVGLTLLQHHFGDLR